MRGHNIIADGLAGAANPHPNPTPHSTPLPTQTPSQKASKTLVFPLFHLGTRMEGWMDGHSQMDGRTKPLIELRVCNLKGNVFAFVEAKQVSCQ